MRKPREYVGQWAVVGGAQRDPLRGGHAAAMLRRNLWIYGLGGLVVPFIGIKVIDVLLTLFGLV
jgi:high-affinity K+ transport system ATPase subunit B